MFFSTLQSKIISILLSAALVVSFIPSMAFADDAYPAGTISQDSQEESSQDPSGEIGTTEDIEGNTEVDNQADNSETSENEIAELNPSLQSATTESKEQEASNEANDQANSWRYVDGEQIFSYEGVSTDADGVNVVMPFSAAPGASSYATWYKSNGTNSYTYKANPSDSGQTISVSGVKRVGIDVSYHQGTIDWAKVKNSGVSFAIIRCGYGSDFTNQDDTQFINNVRGAQANGIDIGVYLYSYAKNTTGSDSSATSEAQHVLRLLNEAGLSPSELAYPVYYDLEESSQASLGPSKIAQLATTFCDIISDAGYDVGIYANKNWWDNHLTDPVFSNSGWHKWVARYPGSNKATSSGVSGTEIWQFSDCGNVNGINGNCDMNFDYVGSYGSPLVWDSNGLRYLNEDGTYFNGGWKTVSGSTYYFKEDGYAAQWGLTLDGKQYYFNEDCTMVTGIVTWAKDGTKSFFGPDGVMTSGWQTWRGKTYYIDPSTMRAVKWGHTIDGQFYYFDEDCSMYNRGWLRWNSDGTYSYFPSNGIRYTGSHWIDGIYYDFGSNGICYTYDYEKASMARMAQEYVSNTGYLIFVNRYTHKVGVFSGGYNNWTLLYYWSCVTGAPNSPTITGSYYTTGFKRPSLSTDSRAIYCTQIWGGYFFHSILSSESELGQSLSHGCIRLPYSAANWIYNNVYAGTRVYIYN